MDRIECPDCKTSYTLERCGLKVPESSGWLRAVVKCSVCGREIRVVAHTEGVLTVPPRWKVWQSPTIEQKQIIEVS